MSDASLPHCTDCGRVEYDCVCSGLKDITPEQHRHTYVGMKASAVFQLEDGRYAVKGPWIGLDGVYATVIFDPQMVIAALKEQLWSEQ